VVDKEITIEEMKRKITPIFQSYPVKKAVLFGSYVKKAADHNSDIDLFIDSDGKLRGLDFVGLLEELYVYWEGMSTCLKKHILIRIHQ